VLFFGRATISDNTKYLYLATVKAAIGCEVLWCAADARLLAELRAHGLPCFDLAADGRQTCNVLLEAAVVVFCENPAAALGLHSTFSGCIAGAQKIQLWHGVSVKHLDLMLIPHLEVRDSYFRRQIRFATRVDHFLSTSSTLDAFWVRAFGCTSLIRAGQPRNEVIVRPPTKNEMIGATLPAELADLVRASAKRKFLLTPTWQRGVPMFVSTPAFYERLTKWLQANNGVAFVKPHPFLRRTDLPADVPGTLHFLDAGVDIYPWMSAFDAMITDYSSIMFDFLLTHRPIFTFNTRTQVSYGFEPDYSLIPEGNFRYDFTAENFEAVLDRNLADHPLQADQRKLSAALFETPAEDACAQLVQFIADAANHVVDKSFTLTRPLKPAELRPAV
jgi:CDP-glycerol glycerophosphotransferase (TagB/SpsB family)